MANKQTLTFSQEWIDPEIAGRLLGANYVGQRLKKPKLVDYLARAIKEGRWNSSLPQPIMVASDGTMLDGQHRCMAIIKAGARVLCWVARNVPIAAYPDIDSGISRQLYDRVSFTPDDLKMNKAVCTVVSAWFWESNKSTRPNPGEAMDLFRKHEPAILWVVRNQRKEKGIGRAQVALAFAQMWERDCDKAQALANTVYGNDMQRKNGIRLREFLLSGKNTRDMSGSHYGFAEYTYKTCVCVCKAELEGKLLKRLTMASW